MKLLCMAGLALALTCACPAQETLAEYDWQKLATNGQLAAGTVVQSDGRSALKVSNPHDTRLLAQLLKISKPPVTKRLYALVGEIKYEKVKGDGFLEMWNYFPPLEAGAMEGQYFSRTLGESGEMGKLTGSSTWRKFTLPFDRTGTSNAPTRLEFNLVLPAQGTVFLGPLKLIQYNGGLSGALAPPGAWWSDQAAGLVGGIGGATFGCLAGVLAWLVARGKSRVFVLGMSWLLIALGGVAAVLGVVALGLGQPYAVWFPCLLIGGLLLLILPFRLRQFQRHYEELELRRMVSLDAAGG